MTSLARRILVPTDFSSTADAALDYARMLAERLGASLYVLHVLEEPLLHEAQVTDAYISQAPHTRSARLQEAHSELALRITDHDRATLRATTEIFPGQSAKTIVESASARGADLIVMGTHGRTGIARMLIGSVAERVVRTAPCPVVTVRGEQSLEGDLAQLTGVTTCLP